MYWAWLSYWVLWVTWEAVGVAVVVYCLTWSVRQVCEVWSWLAGDRP